MAKTNPIAFVITAQIKVDNHDIQRARQWAKRRGYNYKEDIASLVFDYLTDGGKELNMVSTEIENYTNEYTTNNEKRAYNC